MRESMRVLGGEGSEVPEPIREEWFKRHEECAQYYVNAIVSARSHLRADQKGHARYELLRANASIAQGLVWAELLGVTDVGWLERMSRVEELWAQAN